MMDYLLGIACVLLLSVESVQSLACYICSAQSRSDCEAIQELERCKLPKNLQKELTCMTLTFQRAKYYRNGTEYLDGTYVKRCHVLPRSGCPGFCNDMERTNVRNCRVDCCNKQVRCNKSIERKMIVADAILSPASSSTQLNATIFATLFGSFMWLKSIL